MERFLRTLLYISIMLLVMGIIALLLLPPYAVERTISYLVVGLNSICIGGIAMYLRINGKRKDAAAHDPDAAEQRADRVLDALDKRESK